MSTFVRFLLFQAMIILPFAAGYGSKQHLTRPERFTKNLIRLNLIAIEPFIALWSIWGLDLSVDLAFLPMAGLGLVLGGMVLGMLAVKGIGIQGRSRATFIISSSLANHGFTMGGFLCYLFLGERGLGLSFIFISYFMPYIFLVIFPYARLAQTGDTYNLSFLKDFFSNPQNMPLFAIIIALLLRLFGLERPDIRFPVDVLLFISIGLYYYTLGVNFTVRDLAAYNQDNLVLCAIRFLLVPLLTATVLKIVHFSPAIETVILIQSFMPAAVYSVVSSVLFDLDAKRASSLFVFNSVVFLIFILPVLMLFRHMLLGIIA